jgi:hypothetical protein
VTFQPADLSAVAEKASFIPTYDLCLTAQREVVSGSIEQHLAFGEANRETGSGEVKISCDRTGRKLVVRQWAFRFSAVNSQQLVLANHDEMLGIVAEKLAERRRRTVLENLLGLVLLRIPANGHAIKCCRH